MGAPPPRIGRVVAATATALVLGAGLEAALVASCRHQWQVVLSPGPARVDEVVGAVLALAAVLVGAWLAVTALASALSHLPGRLGARLEAWSACWSPALVRRVAAVLVGASIGGGIAPASAAGTPAPLPAPGFSATAVPAPDFSATAVPAPGFSATAPAAAGTGAPSAGAPSAGAPGAARVAPSTKTGPALTSPGFAPTAPPTPGAASEAPPPGWVPPRPVVRPQPAPALVAGPGRRSSGEVVVLRGDSLWSIVARHLGPGATDAEVARAWPLWWEANRSVVGGDPDLVLPGQVLTVPRSGAVTR